MTLSTSRQSRLQAAIDECACKVRDYQRKMKNGDTEITMDIIQEEIQTMIQLRKELKTSSNQEESDTSTSDMFDAKTNTYNNQEIGQYESEKSAEDRVNVLDSWVHKTGSKLEKIEKSLRKVEQSKSNEEMLAKRRNTTTSVKEYSSVEQTHVQAGQSSNTLSDRPTTLRTSDRSDVENGQIGDIKLKDNKHTSQLTSENARLLNETQKLRDEITKLRTTLEEKESKSLEMEKEVLSTKKLLKEEHERFQEQDSDRKNLHVQFSKLQDSRSRLEAEKLNLEALVHEKTIELAGLRSDLKKSMQASSAAQLEHEKKFGLVRESERRLEEECSRMRSEITELTQWKVANDHTVRKLETQLCETQEGLVLANAAKEDVQDKLSMLHKQKLIETSDKEHALERALTAESSLKVVSTELQAVKADLISLEETHRVQSRKHSSIDSELGDLRKKFNAQEILLKKSGVSLHDANEELKEARANVQKYKTLVQSTKQTVFDKTSEMDRTRKQLSRAQTELASALSNNRDNTRNLQQAKETIKNLRQELRQAREEITALATKITSLESATSKLSDDFKSKAKSNYQLSKEADKLRHYRTALAVVIPVFTAVLLYSIIK